MARPPDPLFADPRLAATYDVFEHDRRDLDAYEAIVDEFGARTVLDIGCGTGELAVRLARRGLTVTGLDPAAASVAIARTKADADRVSWVLGDATAIPTVGADLAVMTGNVAQVFVDDAMWTETLHGVAAALRPGGHFVFETRVPEQRAWERWIPEHTRARAALPDGDTVETWCELLSVAGPLVTFRWTNRFESDGAVLVSDSTLRFRSQAEVEQSLDEADYDVIDVRDAPDRPGKEMVFIARRR